MGKSKQSKIQSLERIKAKTNQRDHYQRVRAIDESAFRQNRTRKTRFERTL